ncbi:hypothetical protein MIMGU_mgv1a017024mg [Erythranthe guttata]|uniref:Uncharacterized protein n=1 Tax=Erythranthe guttata TaxID=4155 RepID=A0A022S1Q0_ERYGU|nr:hypothetical protein MIMGU_mgv1a017024mg [Erythranthe guttata]
MVISPTFSNAKISSVDIAFTSFATAPIDFPSFLPRALKSGSARRVAYFKVSLHVTKDLMLSSSSTYSFSLPAISSKKSASGCTITISLSGALRGLL